jgi:hypothetical protein
MLIKTTTYNYSINKTGIKSYPQQIRKTVIAKQQRFLFI